MTKIIAEIGVNHNGILKKAIQLVKLAKSAGVDYVKFQIYKTDLLVTSYAKKSAYQKIDNKDQDRQYSMLKKYELSFKEHKKIFSYCKKMKINYCASAFDESSLDFLINLNVKIIKIASGEITNKLLLERLKKYKGLILLSTGMSTLNEVADAVKILIRNRNKFNLMYCCSSYPAPIEEIDMNIMKTLNFYFKCPIGFSDHTTGIKSAISSVLLEAPFIEKHFTDNKKLSGPDHKSSFDFNDMKKLVQEVKKFKSLFKSGNKIVTKSEKDNRKNSRKSIVAKKKIFKGEYFSKKNLATKRPGDGISPMDINKLLKLKAKKTFLPDEQIKI